MKTSTLDNLLTLRIETSNKEHRSAENTIHLTLPNLYPNNYSLRKVMEDHIKSGKSIYKIDYLEFSYGHYRPVTLKHNTRLV